MVTPDGSRVMLGASTQFEVESDAKAGALALFKLDIGTIKAWVTSTMTRRFRVRTPRRSAPSAAPSSRWTSPPRARP
ncbi:MAG: FecR domain-containing protein [Elusimicrobiota bacterium]|nr:MAG: FecR domain-containing protein [Elusimicrobiota bacterium]